MGRIFEFVCLFVCLSVCLFIRSITQKRMIPKCSNIGISYKWHGFGLKGQRPTLGLTAVRHGFELYECLLVYAYLADWRWVLGTADRVRSPCTCCGLWWWIDVIDICRWLVNVVSGCHDASRFPHVLSSWSTDTVRVLHAWTGPLEMQNRKILIWKTTNRSRNVAFAG